jgi:hypothetical protein
VKVIKEGKQTRKIYEIHSLVRERVKKHLRVQLRNCLLKRLAGIKWSQLFCMRTTGKGPGGHL